MLGALQGQETGSTLQLGRGLAPEGAAGLPSPPCLPSPLPERGHFGMLIGNTGCSHSPPGAASPFPKL